MATAARALNKKGLLSRAGTLVMKAFVRLYQLLLSPLLGGRCRFTPSCSYYALDALEQHGPIRGTWLSIKRVGRCHPFSPGGFDPVPEAGSPSRDT